MCIGQYPHAFTQTYVKYTRGDDRCYAVEQVSDSEMIMCGSCDPQSSGVEELTIFFAERNGDQWERGFPESKSYEWAQFTNNCFYDITKLPDGYIVLTGRIGMSPNIGDGRLIICRIDPEGNISGVWSNSGGGTVGYDILAEEDASIIAVGQWSPPIGGTMGMIAYHLIPDSSSGRFRYYLDWSFSSHQYTEWQKNERALCAIKLSNGKYVIGGENISQTDGATFYVLDSSGEFYADYHFPGEAVRDMISLPTIENSRSRFLALISYSGEEGVSTSSFALAEFTVVRGGLRLDVCEFITPASYLNFVRGMRLERMDDYDNSFVISGSYSNGHGNTGVFVSVLDENYVETEYYIYSESEWPNSFNMNAPSGFHLWYNGINIGCFLATTLNYDFEHTDVFWAYHNEIGYTREEVKLILRNDDLISVDYNNESIILTVNNCTESDHIQLDLYDMTGRIISSHQSFRNSNSSSFIISTVSIPSGVYFAVMETENETYTRKLVIFK